MMLDWMERVTRFPNAIIKFTFSGPIKGGLA